MIPSTSRSAEGGGISPSTSTSRTYRYVRLAILGVVLALTVSVAQVLVDGPLASISAVHYTAGSAMFTGTLVAISLAFVVLAGRSPSQALLDLAALLAPLVAIMPTPIQTGDAPGVVIGCDVPCVPDAELPAIGNGLTTWFVVASLSIVAAAVLGVVQRTLGRGLVATLVVAASVVAGAAVWGAISPDSFVLAAHVVAATAFFALIAAVSALAAGRTTGRFRTLYLVTALVLVADLVGIVAVVVLRFVDIDLVASTGVPLVFVGEVAALALFALFWAVQTTENWNDPDPEVRSLSRAPVPRAG